MEPLEAAWIESIQLWFGYDPDRGVLIRLKKTRSDAHDEINPTKGTVFFRGRWFDYAALCWIVHYSRSPVGIVDHKNRIKHDHKLSNLREATDTQNQQNKASYGKYAKGVTWRARKEKPFQAKIRVNGKQLHLGSFSKEEDAAQAYREAAFKYHGEFACVD